MRYSTRMRGLSREPEKIQRVNLSLEVLMQAMTGYLGPEADAARREARAPSKATPFRTCRETVVIRAE